MKIDTNLLIDDLVERTRQNMNHAEEFRQYDLGVLNWRAHSKSWSALESLEHVNLYGDYYLPEIEHRINTAKRPSQNGYYKSSWLGNLFAEAVLPKEKLNKMKTFKDKNPLGSSLDRSTIDRFIQQQKHMLELLSRARETDLTKTITSTSLSKLIRLRLGDTLRVVIYHNQRHIVQSATAIRNCLTAEKI